MVTGLIMGIVGIVVVFYLVSGLAPTLTNAANNISASGLPLASLFSSSGVTIIIIVLAIFVGVIYAAFKMMHTGK